MVKTQSLIFTIYGDYIRQYENRIWAGSLIRLLDEFNHRPQAVRMSLSRMTQQGWLDRERPGRKSFYVLTKAGESHLQAASDRIFKIRKAVWDGRWMLVILHNNFDDAKNRKLFLKELKWHGFGRLAANVHISPNSLYDEIGRLRKKYNAEHSVDIFATEYCEERSVTLIKKCWDIKAMNGQYNDFFERFSKDYLLDKQKLRERRLSGNECFVKRVVLTHEYRKFLFTDPGLPAELMPEEWLGHHAAELFNEYYHLLGKKAIGFFEDVFFEGNDSSGSASQTDENIKSFPWKGDLE